MFGDALAGNHTEPVEMMAGSADRGDEDGIGDASQSEGASELIGAKQRVLYRCGDADAVSIQPVLADVSGDGFGIDRDGEQAIGTNDDVVEMGAGSKGDVIDHAPLGREMLETSGVDAEARWRRNGDVIRPPTGKRHDFGHSIASAVADALLRHRETMSLMGRRGKKPLSGAARSTRR